MRFRGRPEAHQDQTPGRRDHAASPHRRQHSEISVGQSQRSSSKDSRESDHWSSPTQVSRMGWSSLGFLQDSQPSPGQSSGKSDHRRASPYQDVSTAQNRRSEHQRPSLYRDLSPAQSRLGSAGQASPAQHYSPVRHSKNRANPDNIVLQILIGLPGKDIWMNIQDKMIVVKKG